MLNRNRTFVNKEHNTIEYGYSKFSSFLKSFGCFEIVGDRVKLTDK